MGGGDTDESWEPPDDTEMNHCIDYPEDADYEPEICSDKGRQTYSWKAEKFPLHAASCHGDVAVPASRDAASFSCPTTVSAGSKRKLQGLHGKQNAKKAREAQAQKWSAETGGQADSLVQLLKTLQIEGTIEVTYDPCIQPHGIARIDVFDPEAFRSARLRWFQRADITGSGGEPEPPGRPRGLEDSVNQAFRRIGLLPGRSAGVRGHDWARGRVWTFDRETYARYKMQVGGRRRAAAQAEESSAAESGGAAAAVTRLNLGKGAGVWPACCICPISKAVMVDPVLLAAARDGLSYERSAVTAHLRRNCGTGGGGRIHPLTGRPLRSAALIPNTSLRGIIAALRPLLAAAAPNAVPDDCAASPGLPPSPAGA